VTDSSTPSLDLAALDQLTGGAFSVSNATDRTARLRDWLAGHPSLEQLQAVFDEMSHRDKGAAKVLREKLDELRRSKDQDALIVEWAAKGEALRDAPTSTWPTLWAGNAMRPKPAHLCRESLWRA